MPPAARLSPDPTVRAARARGAALVRKAAREALASHRLLAECVALALPSPVSVNEIYSRKSNGQVRISDAYAAWRKEAGWRLVAQKPGRIAGRFQMRLSLPQGSGLDLDNATKAVCDLLEEYGVIRNDRDAERILLDWHGTGPDALVEVLAFDPADPVMPADWKLPSREVRT